MDGGDYYRLGGGHEGWKTARRPMQTARYLGIEEAVAQSHSIASQHRLFLWYGVHGEQDGVAVDQQRRRVTQMT